LQVAGVKLTNNFKWLEEVTGNKLTENLMNTLQSGFMYLLGRDNQYRCTVVFDLPKIIEFGVTNPQMVSTENVSLAFAFLWSFMKKVMFLPG
jgi:hypothetical protein